MERVGRRGKEEMKNNETEIIHNNSKVKKVIIYIACTILIVGSFVLCEELLYKYKVEQVKQMGYTQYDLSSVELYYLSSWYNIYVSENDSEIIKPTNSYVKSTTYCNIYVLENGSEIIEPTNSYIKSTTYYNKKDKMVLCEGAYASDTVDKFNEIVHDYPEVQERALKYGITEDNPLTVEWILSHPREALSLVKYSDIVLPLTWCNPWITDR